jgi:hypothetical protein
VCKGSGSLLTVSHAVDYVSVAELGNAWDIVQMPSNCLAALNCAKENQWVIIEDLLSYPNVF